MDSTPPSTGHRARVVPRLLVWAAALTTALALTVGLVVAPPDAAQGTSQRLMYVHVPSAWVAYLCFLTVLVGSLGYVRGRDLRWDRVARAAAELGVGLTALAIVTGALWGRVTWGVWWTWDARLVTTTVLLVVYVGYLGVRGLGEDPHTNARRAAVVGVLGFVNVPLVHFSVVWWRTLHQPPTILAPGTDPPIAPIMAAALGLAMLASTLLAGVVISRRVVRLARAAERTTAAASSPPATESAAFHVVAAPGRTDREAVP